MFWQAVPLLLCKYVFINVIVWKQSLTDLNVYAIQNGHGLRLHFYIDADAMKNYGSFDVDFFFFYALLTIFIIIKFQPMTSRI